MIKQSFVGIFLFFILNLIAMFLYPGGTIIDSTTEGYLFFYNFFSNLGEWTAQNGMDNFYSASLFNLSNVPFLTNNAVGLFFLLAASIQINSFVL